MLEQQTQKESEYKNFPFRHWGRPTPRLQACVFLFFSSKIEIMSVLLNKAGQRFRSVPTLPSLLYTGPEWWQEKETFHGSPYCSGAQLALNRRTKTEAQCAFHPKFWCLRVGCKVLKNWANTRAIGLVSLGEMSSFLVSRFWKGPQAGVYKRWKKWKNSSVMRNPLLN